LILDEYTAGRDLPKPNVLELDSGHIVKTLVSVITKDTTTDEILLSHL